MFIQASVLTLLTNKSHVYIFSNRLNLVHICVAETILSLYICNSDFRGEKFLSTDRFPSFEKI